MSFEFNNIKIKILNNIKIKKKSFAKGLKFHMST